MGIINGTCYDPAGNLTEKYLFYIEYTEGKQSIEGNYTPLTVTLKVRRNPNYAAAATAYNLTGGVSVTLSIDGEDVFNTTTAKIDTRNAQIWTFTTLQRDIDHETNGAKAVTIAASFSDVGAKTLEYGELNGEIVLASIPRASSISLAKDTEIGRNAHIEWIPLSESFHYKVTISILGKWLWTSELIHPNTANTFSFETLIPIEVANYFQKDSAAANMIVSLYTYSDTACNNQIGEAQQCTFNVTLPQNEATIPTVDITLTPTGLDGFDDVYIQGKSRACAALTAVGKYGAEIASYEVSVDGKVYTGPDVTTNILLNSGTVKVHGKVVDSRGFATEITREIVVVPYSKPRIVNVLAYRCDSSGDSSDAGTYLKVEAKRTYSPVKAGDEQKNFCSISFCYKTVNAANYGVAQTILDGKSLDSNEVKTESLLDGRLDVTTSYLVQIWAEDLFEKSEVVTINIPTDRVYCHRDGARRSFTFGGYCQDNEPNTFAIAEGIEFLVKGEKWIDLGSHQDTKEPIWEVGRVKNGCKYRVVNGNHVFVAFNRAIDVYDGVDTCLNATLLPPQYCPLVRVYSLCQASDEYIATVCVTPEGQVLIDHVMHGGYETIIDSNLTWVDGYIDYFV